MANICACPYRPVKGPIDLNHAQIGSHLPICSNAESDPLDSSQPTETLVQASDPEYLLIQGRYIDIASRGQFSSSISGIYITLQ